ncbi:MAG: ATP-binding protein [Gammaproteobacteria bacterium]|nr:ATP-binding protein [Gammaproteobacteria bacterium]
MSSVFSRLTTRVSLAMVLVVALSMAMLVRHWIYVTAPTLKAAEQTKAELLVTPYTQLLETAVDTNNQKHLEAILNQLIVLEDPTYKQPIVVGLKVTLMDGTVFDRRNKVSADSVPFHAESPIFSPTTMHLLGSVELEYNDAFYKRVIDEVWWEVVWSIGLAFLLLIAMELWVRRLLNPMTELSNRLATLNIDSQVALPPAGRSMSSEIRQVWSALDLLFARLRQRDRALEREHAAAQHALQAKLDAEAVSKEKSQFLANMSHELRTPLNAIIGYSEMLYEEVGASGNAEMAGDLVRIVSSGRHLLSLISDVLDLSKIEAGKMQLYLDGYGLRQLVDDVVVNVKPMIAANGNTLSVECDSDIGSIYADIPKLKQALINLMGNAAKFTHAGNISLSVERVAGAGVEWIVFRVADTGIGISDEQKNILFKAFTQADESTTREYGGTGLGLTISRSVCRLMGGDITVESQQGKGSTFTIKVPATVEEPHATESGVGRPVAEKKSVSNDGECRNVDAQRARQPMILVIDNDPFMPDLLERSLDEDGYCVEVVDNGKAGLERAMELMPDLILLDVVLPGVGGWSILSQLKDEPLLASIPVIMHSMIDERATAMSLGAADYIIKPADHATLVECINRNLQAPGGPRNA